MSDPQVKPLIEKAEELKAMNERLLEQGRKLKERADASIAESKKPFGEKGSELP
jgi:hypothetical protein